MRKQLNRTWCTRSSGNIVATLFFAVVASSIAAFVGINYGQRILDTVIASQFSPPSQIVAIKNTLKLTDEGRTVFYASQPKVQDQVHFNDSCKSTERTAAMLGCYYKRQIYLFDITNEELQGALEVTAAHEMLHAAYDRLPFYEKNKIDQLVQDEYQQVKNDQTIKDLVAYYEKAEPGSVTNELHSILGTTVSSLNAELEQHYEKYFTDRQSIVFMNEKYSAVFKKVQDEAASLSKKISAEGKDIERKMSQYEADRKQLESDIDVFNQRASSGEFTSQGSFQVARTALSSRATAISQRRDELNSKVDSYNQLVEQLNRLSVRSDELNKSINGITTPETKL